MRRFSSPCLLFALAFGVLTACGDAPAEPDPTETPRRNPVPERSEDATFRLPALPLPTLDSVVPDPPPPPPEPVVTPASDPLRGANYTIEPASQPAADGETPPDPTADPPGQPAQVNPAPPAAQPASEPEQPEEPEEPEDTGPELMSLADFEGEPLVLHFFASWCEPCLDEMRGWERAVASSGAAAPTDDANDDGEDEETEDGAAQGGEESDARPGGIRRLGILEEQHPERARLYLQWQRLELPVLVDSLDLYRLSDLPVTLLVDRAGNARFAPPVDQAEEGIRWLLEDRPARGRTLPPAYDEVPDLDALFERTRVEAGEDTAESDRALETYAQALYLWGGSGLLSTAIESYESLMERDPDIDGWHHFRLGTLYRSRYDSEHRRPEDFATAVRMWQGALARAPHNQIFRRRLQQYGPRMTKPFAFYDWLPTARQAVRGRGEVPIPTPARLTRSETADYAPPPEIADPFADPLARPEENPRLRRRGGQDQAAPQAEPLTIPVDSGTWVKVDTLTVPSTARPGEAARVYFTLRPADGVAWQPGSEILVRLLTPDTWRAGAGLIGIPVSAAAPPPNPRGRRPGTTGGFGPAEAATASGAATSEPNVTTVGAIASGEDATRRLEIDVRIPDNARRGRARLPAEVQYTVCRNGGCTLLRQKLPMTVGVDSGAPSLTDEVVLPETDEAAAD